MQIENFIFQKRNALSNEQCKVIIEDGLNLLQTGIDDCFKFEGDAQFEDGKLGRNDTQLFIPTVLHQHFELIQNVIFDGLHEYGNEIASVKDCRLVSPVFKWQKTPVSGGYSVWHCEQGGGGQANRALAWMIYLNDITDGGETEFCYQGLKCKAETGKLVIWPAGITHPHRGNPPYSGEKYIVTGWFEHPDREVYHQALRSLLRENKLRG